MVVRCFMRTATQHSNVHYVRSYRMSWFAAAVWTALLVLSLLWNAYNEQARVIELAKAEARANLGKDKAFRLWATSKGGFYIPVSEHTRPSPFLANIPLRDVKTTSGTVMTLFNPATVIKEIGEQFQELSGVQAKITNKVYLNPENAPDEWELKVLRRFEQGESEVFDVSQVGGREYLRLAQSMKLEAGCLKCHAGAVGGLGGSTGVAIPLDPYRHLAQGAVVNMAETHGGIWLVGLGLIGFIGRRTRKYEVEREAAECELRKLSRAVEVSASAIMIMNAQDEIQYVNGKFCEITGYSVAEVIGQHSGILKSSGSDQELHHKIAETLRNGHEWKGEVRNRKKDGTEICCLESLSSISDDAGQITHFVSVMEDISERKQNEETILQLAYFDPLTELPNRRNFYERLEQLAASCRRSGGKMALLYIDLDSFKNINDTMGHAAGDELLKIVAQRLSSSLMRETDVVARLGGDEFAVIIQDASRDIVATVSHKLVCAARQELMLGGKVVRPTISVGISMFPDDSGNLDELARFSDIALYKAKEQGKNTSCFYS